jgi:hypothetical protein
VNGRRRFCVNLSQTESVVVESIADRVRRSRREQGLPESVNDPEVLERLTQILQSGSPSRVGFQRRGPTVEAGNTSMDSTT